MSFRILLASLLSCTHRSRARAACRLGVEALEERQVLSLSLSGGTLSQDGPFGPQILDNNVKAYVTASAGFPSILYDLHNDGGIYQQTGSQWTQIGTGDSIATASDGQLYAHTTDGLVLERIGNNWDAIASGVHSMAEFGGNLYASADGGFIYEHLSESVWNVVASGVNVMLNPGDGNLYAYTTGGFVYQRQGDDWAVIASGVNYIATPGDGNLYAYTGGGFIYQHQGNGWVVIASGVTGAYYPGDGNFYVLTGGGDVFQRAGNTWDSIASSVATLSTPGDGTFTATTFGGAVYTRQDGAWVPTDGDTQPATPPSNPPVGTTEFNQMVVMRNFEGTYTGSYDTTVWDENAEESTPVQVQVTLTIESMAPTPDEVNRDPKQNDGGNFDYTGTCTVSPSGFTPISVPVYGVYTCTQFPTTFSPQTGSFELLTQGNPDYSNYATTYVDDAINDWQSGTCSTDILSFQKAGSYYLDITGQSNTLTLTRN